MLWSARSAVSMAQLWLVPSIYLGSCVFVLRFLHVVFVLHALHVLVLQNVCHLVHLVRRVPACTRSVWSVRSSLRSQLSTAEDLLRSGKESSSGGYECGAARQSDYQAWFQTLSGPSDYRSEGYHAVVGTLWGQQHMNS
jgi:hypothetical protein